MSEFQDAKAAYAYLLQATVRLGARPLTAEDISDGSNEFLQADTVANYLKGKTAPPSAEKNGTFIGYIESTLRLKGSTRLDEFADLKEKLLVAYTEVERTRRHKKLVPVAALVAFAPAVSTDANAIRRVLAASAAVVDAFLDSADFYGMSACIYFSDIGVRSSDWKGPLTYLGAIRDRCDPTSISSLTRPPQQKNSPLHGGQANCFDGMRATLAQFPEEFAAMPQLRDVLYKTLAACDALADDLAAYWELNRPCAENPFFDPPGGHYAAHREAVTKAFRDLPPVLLSRDPEYVVRLREVALHADGQAAEVKQLARAALAAMKSEMIRRGAQARGASDE